MLRSDKGFTVIEMFVALGIFAGIMVITTMLLRQSVWVWTSTDSREDAGMVLSKARNALMRELAQADLDPGDSGEPHFGLSQTPAALGGGDAVWFLSARGSSGEFSRDSDGYPYWQRNILFYLAKPQDHDALFGMSCAPASNPTGDEICPHKMLLRVVIDFPPATTPLPSPPAHPGPGDFPEDLISSVDITNYLIAPQGQDVGAIQSQSGVEEVSIVATGLLWFKVQPAPGAPDAGLQIDLRSVAVKEASKVSSVGSVSLFNSPQTLRNIFSIFPNN
ncbi:MAG: hypothetical protein WC314_19235 [Vulcanimicrobiota bacterium]